MDESGFRELLRKYLNGNSTKEESEFVVKYYELFDSEPDVMELLNKDKKEELKSDIKNKILNNIKSTNLGMTRPPVRKLSIIRVAAAAVILILFSGGLYFLNHSSSVDRAIISSSEQGKDHRLVRLPDGSIVIVSSGSKLNYPSSFDGLSQREVYLEGQAYFDVKHNAEKPFIIHTGKIVTTVLGTAFSIEAWPLDEDITVTVTRGSVKVDNELKTLGVLSPHQQITYNKEKADVVKKIVNIQDFLDWKEQDLLLDDVTFKEAAELLQDHFKVTILFTDKQMESKRFTTTFLKGESLDQVLKSICDFNEAAYQYDKGKASVHITNK